MAATFITATGIAAAAVTLTIPAVVGRRCRVFRIMVDCYTTAARTGGTTPVIATSTNAAALAMTFSSAAAVGTTERISIDCSDGADMDASNTATTIVCPATTSVIWRVTVVYENVPY